MATDRETLIKQLDEKEKLILRIQGHFRDLSTQYIRSKRRWEFVYCVQLVIIIVLAGINILDLKL